MEDDKALRKLLNEGAMLKAHEDFSAKVMTGINQLKPVTIQDAKKWKFVFTVITSLVVMAAVFLSFFINPDSLPHVYLETLYAIPTTYLITTAEYLGAFWLLLAISYVMNKDWVQNNRQFTSTN